jgi:nucleoside diphosphate kinase
MPCPVRFATDVFLFALTARIALALMNKDGASICTPKGDSDLCEATSLKLKNSAFVFIKPHANTATTQAFVKTKLEKSGLSILSECDIDGPKIDKEKLIDQHYYAIASKATILPAKDIPVPADKFEAEFGEKWPVVLADNRACNAMEACEIFQCSTKELNDAWQKAKAVKFGGGFYCAHFSVREDGPKLYVFNAFFMTMRDKFCQEGTSIHCYEVEWDPAVLSWSGFRNKLLGPTDPADAPADSIRGTILSEYKEFGLSSVPNKGDNGVHASASPFEGLAEKSNWLKRSVEETDFGKALLGKGLSIETIKEWSVDPRVHLPEGGQGSVFDALEDMDAADCLTKLIEINAANEDTI